MKAFAAAAALFVLAVPALADPQANVAVARRVFDDIYNKRDFAAASSIYAPDFVNHGRTRDIGSPSASAGAQSASGAAAAMPCISGLMP